MPSIYDNDAALLRDGLERVLSGGIGIDASVGYFNLRGWVELNPAVESLSPRNSDPAARILVGMLLSPDEELRQSLRLRGDRSIVDGKERAKRLGEVVLDLRKQLTLGLPTASDKRGLQRLREHLMSGRVAVRVHLRQRLHAKLYIARRDDLVTPVVGFVGSSNLTLAGMRGQGELNIDVLEQDAATKLAGWFEERWDDDLSVDVSRELADLIDVSWAGSQLPPYLIYLLVAWRLSRDAREGQVAFEIPPDVSSQLLDFQAAAVRMAARTLQRRGGAMVGDVVGLGKTLVATSVARVFEESEGAETLIICPKNLEEMWQSYVHAFRLRGARVLPISMAAKKLPEFPRYRLVVVDESHNLRRNTRLDYAALKDYIARNDPKVLLLTATPYNVAFSDVANQIGLFLPDDSSLPIRPDEAIRSVGGIAEWQKRAWGSLPESLAAFRRSDSPEDWRRLMSLFLIRRTRAFIKKHYAMRDGRRYYLTFANDPGKRYYFPERKTKVVRGGETDDNWSSLSADHTLDVLSSLRLSRFRLGGYLQSEGTAEPSLTATIARLMAAPSNLIGFIRSSLFKRLASGGAAFTLSLQRHLLRDLVLLAAVESGGRLPVSAFGEVVMHEAEDGDDDDVVPWDSTQSSALGRMTFAQAETIDVHPYDAYFATATAAYQRMLRSSPKSVAWLPSDLMSAKLHKDLVADAHAVHELLGQLGPWRQRDDGKLERLTNLLSKKHSKDKVLIFTEYKDTAEYLGHALEARGLAHVGVATGSSDHPTDLARRFSPRSNSRLGALRTGEDELRVLVSTDVLSEGQNLQDAHVIVNYDLPWAIVRIIQRAGRVDRIGQESPVVLVYSFDVPDGVNGILRLRQRIRERLERSAVVFGADDRFFGTERDAQVIEGLYDETKPFDPEDLVASDVDPASYAYEIWREAIDEDPTLEERVRSLPSGVVSTIRVGQSAVSNAVVTLVGSEAGWDASVLADSDGSVTLLDPIQALQRIQCAPGTEPGVQLAAHFDLVRDGVDRVLEGTESGFGILGGLRKRVYERLRGHHSVQSEGLFADPKARLALDRLFQRPLSSEAAQILAGKLVTATDEDLLQLVMLLDEEGRLVMDDDAARSGDLSVVASMGLTRSGRH